MDYSDKVICSGARAGACYDGRVCKHAEPHTRGDACGYSHCVTLSIHKDRVCIPFKFQVDDRIKLYGRLATITNAVSYNSSAPILCFRYDIDVGEGSWETSANNSDIKFISRGGVKVGQKEKLKARINAVCEHTTIKEFDDLLCEIGDHVHDNSLRGAYRISMPHYSGVSDIIIIDCTRNWKAIIYYPYSNHCEKLKAIKKAMFWLLNKAVFKDDKRQKLQGEINRLEVKMDKLREEFKNMKE